MPKASENLYPKIIGVEGAAPATPAAATAILYVKADGLWYSKDDAGVETLVSGGVGGGDLSDQGAFTYLDATEAAAPGTPASGYARIYAKTDGRIYSKDDAGVEYGPFDVAGGGSAATRLGLDYMRYPFTTAIYGDGSVYSANGDAGATDGSNASSSNSGVASFPQDASIDFGTPRPVSRMDVVYSDANHSSKTGTLDYSSDGSSWTTAATWTDDATTTRSHTFTETSARYWRIHSTVPGAGGNGINITDLRLLSGGTNYAAGLTPTSNRSYSNIAQACDGWDNLTADDQTGAFPQYLRVDLGAAHDIETCVIRWKAATHRSCVGRLEYSTDDSTWLVAYSWKLAEAITAYYCLLDAAISARYWRVYSDATAGGGAGVNFAEWELWG